MTFASGDKYDGNWQNDSQTGKGLYTWKDGTTYEGGFIEGKKNGTGKN